MRQFSYNNNLTKSGSVHRNFSQGGSVMNKINSAGMYCNRLDIVDRIVTRESRKFRWSRTDSWNLEEDTSTQIKGMRKRKAGTYGKFPKPPQDVLREKLIADQQNLINSWVKNAEGRKASLLADHKGGKFQFPRLPKGSTFMIDWDRLISEIKQATTLEGAYQAFLTFHDVVDESLSIAGDFHAIWEEFVMSDEKKLVEKRLVSERKKERRLPYGVGYTCSKYWVKERQHKKGETNE